MDGSVLADGKVRLIEQNWMRHVEVLLDNLRLPRTTVGWIERKMEEGEPMPAAQKRTGSHLRSRLLTLRPSTRQHRY